MYVVRTCIHNISGKKNGKENARSGSIKCHEEVFQREIRTHVAGRPGSSEVPRNPLTRWDVSSIPANGIFLTKN